MYDFSIAALNYIPWIIVFLYCGLTPLIAIMDSDNIIYPLLASVLFAVIGAVFVVLNVVSTI